MQLGRYEYLPEFNMAEKYVRIVTQLQADDNLESVCADN